MIISFAQVVRAKERIDQEIQLEANKQVSKNKPFMCEISPFNACFLGIK